MSVRRFDDGRLKTANDTVNFSTGAFKMMALTLNTASNIVKAITGATNASPIVLTITSHGWANGDIIVVRGVGGNTAANGTYVIAGQTTNTVNLTTVPATGGTALNTTGNGAYTSGGTAINLTKASASTDISAGRVAGSSDPTLTITTALLGKGIISTSTTPSFTVNASAVTDAFVFYQITPTDVLLNFDDGKMLVRAAALAASSATAIVVEPLPYGIPNGTALVFSNGVTATLTTLAAAGDRSLTVSALSGAIGGGHTTDAPITGANLPLVAGSSSSTINVTVDAVNGLLLV